MLAQMPDDRICSESLIQTNPYTFLLLLTSDAEPEHGDREETKGQNQECVEVYRGRKPDPNS